MFDFVRKHTKVLQVILFLLIFPSFVLFGIQGYDRFTGDGNLAAKVDGMPITLQQLDNAQRDQVARMQQALGAAADLKSLDTPQSRMATLEGLIRQALLQVLARKQRLQVGDAQVQQAILQIPQIAALRRADGSFDVDAYRKLIESQGMTTGQFEASVREQLLMQQAQGNIPDTALDSKVVAQQLYNWRNQQRQVRLASWTAGDFAAKVQPTPEQIQAYYRSHPEQFRTAEQADVQYVVLSLDALRQGITISAQQAKAYYDQHKAEFATPEQRKASHILIALPPKATPQEEQQAKAKADAIAAEVRKDPGAFAAIAKRESQDPGSAADGGNLGFFAKDAMVAPVADAVFGMSRAGDIVGPVRSSYGYHVIELTGIKPGQTRSFEQAQADIVTKLQEQEARKQFADLSDKFSNMVYEDSRSFDQVAARFHLQVQSVQGVSPTPREGNPKANPLSNPRFMQALFGAQSVRDKRNIPALEIAPYTLVSGRIVTDRPAGTLSFEQAQAKARELLVQQQAAQLAAQAGEQALQAARDGKAQPQWGPTQSVSLTHPEQAAGVAPEVIDAVFRADVSKLPVLLGVKLPGQGYAMVSVDAVSQPAPDAEQLRAQEGTLSQVQAQAMFQAYLESLKSRYGVKVFYDPAKQSAAQSRG